MVALLFVIAVAAGAYFMGKAPAKAPVAPTPLPAAEATVAPSAMPSTASPTAAASDSELITKALYEKNQWPEGSVTVSVTSNDGTYAKGMAGGQGGGGLFFAEKKAGAWKIVYDGNGIIPCDNLKDYPDFPKTLIPTCFDQAAGTTVKR